VPRMAPTIRVTRRHNSSPRRMKSRDRRIGKLVPCSIAMFT
jgi:hypothetical protein